jgi:hypothetical protein
MIILKKFFRIFFFLITIALTFWSCATPYQSVGFTGGYSETQLDTNVFQVNFRGNGYTSIERATDFSLLRCAELADMHGFQYFTIIDAKEYYKNSAYSTPTQTKTRVSVYGNTAYGNSTTYGGQTYIISKPRTSNTIVCFKSKPEGFSYNAKFLINSLKEKYDLFTPEEKQKLYYNKKR